MNKTYTVTINSLTETDMRDIFYEAIEKLGVKAGDKIFEGYKEWEVE